MQTNLPTRRCAHRPASRLARLISTSAAGVIAACLLLGSARVGAQNAMEPDGQTNAVAGPATTVAKADQKFMTSAAQDGLLEVKLGALAAQKATREDVKSFAQKMVTDHTQINNDLKALAALKGDELPDALDPKHQEIYDKLASLQGADFDNEYVAAMIKGHQAAVRLFKRASGGQDTDIKSFADKTLPVIQEHLTMVKTMNKS